MTKGVLARAPKLRKTVRSRRASTFFTKKISNQLKLKKKTNKPIGRRKVFLFSFFFFFINIYIYISGSSSGTAFIVLFAVYKFPVELYAFYKNIYYTIFLFKKQVFKKIYFIFYINQRGLLEERRGICS